MRTDAIRLDASTSMEQARVIAREVKSLQPGAFFGALINPRTCINMIRAFKEIDYLPGFASWTVCIAVPDVWIELGDGNDVACIHITFTDTHNEHEQNQHKQRNRAMRSYHTSLSPSPHRLEIYGWSHAMGCSFTGQDVSRFR